MSTPTTRATIGLPYDTMNLNFAIGDKRGPVSFKIEDIPTFSEETQKIFRDLSIFLPSTEGQTGLMEFPQKQKIEIFTGSIKGMKIFQQFTKTTTIYGFWIVALFVGGVAALILLAPAIASLSLPLCASIIGGILLVDASLLICSVFMFKKALEHRKEASSYKERANKQRLELEDHKPEMATHLTQSTVHHMKALKLSEELTKRIPWSKDQLKEWKGLSAVMPGIPALEESIDGMEIALTQAQKATKFYRDIISQLRNPSDA